MGARASSDLFVSDMTLAELERGVLRLPPSRRQSELATWLAAVQAGYGQRAPRVRHQPLQVLDLLEVAILNCHYSSVI